MIQGIPSFSLNNNFHRSIVDGNALRLRGTQTGSVVSEYDPGREYRINSFGYRGQEFSKDAKILAAGCSFTFGTGADEAAIWPSVLAKTLNLTHNNLSKSGASISWIVEKVFNYFKEFGHPEYLFCLFPDTKRFIAPVDGILLTKDQEINPKNLGEPGSLGAPGQYLYNEMGKNYDEIVSSKYLKRPYNIRDLHTPELGLYLAVRQIRILEQYCKSANIKFLWGTWDFELSYYVSQINSEEDLRFSNYAKLDTLFYKKREDNRYRDAIFTVDMGIESEALRYVDCINSHDNIECSCFHRGCHSDLVEIYGERDFNTGSDTTYGDMIAHPGAHLHAHYAEKFIEQLMLKFSLKPDGRKAK